MRKRAGYTLIELMLVVAILGILSALALPKAGSVIRRANEAGTLGRLRSIRSALTIYYASVEGAYYPADLSLFAQPGNDYYRGNLDIFTSEHGKITVPIAAPAFDPALDTGQLAYVTQGSNDWGRVWVQCTHTDSKSSVWAQY